MRAFMGFHDESQKAIAQGHSWAKVREATSSIQNGLRNMKFEVPTEGEEKISKKVSHRSIYQVAKQGLLTTRM